MKHFNHDHQINKLCVTVKTKICFLAVTIFVSTLLFISCSKSDDKPTEPVNDCATKNYGVITVNFANLTEKHAIDVFLTSNATFIKSKIVAIGVASDTIRLKTGNYSLSVGKVNDQGAALDEVSNYPNRQVSQCSTQIINAPN
jgi:hypothetical protein